MSDQLLNQILEEIKRMNNRMDSLEATVQDTNNRMDHEFKRMDNRFKRMDNRFKSMNDRMASFETTLQDTRAQITSRFDTMETKLSNVEVDVSTLKTKVAFMAEGQQRIEGTLKRIIERMDRKDYEVQALNKRLFQVESTIEKLTAEDQ